MGQSVWHRDDVKSIALALMLTSPSEEFAAGVMALAFALGANVPQPPQRAVVPVVVMDSNGKELTP